MPVTVQHSWMLPGQLGFGWHVTRRHSTVKGLGCSLSSVLGSDYPVPSSKKLFTVTETKPGCTKGGEIAK